MYRHFVYHFISEEVEQDIIEPLAQNFLTNDYSIPDMLKVLMKSQHFYDEDTPATTSDNNVGALIKSPVDVFTTLLRFFEVSTPDRDTDTSNFYADLNSWFPNSSTRGSTSMNHLKWQDILPTTSPRVQPELDHDPCPGAQVPDRRYPHEKRRSGQ